MKDFTRKIFLFFNFAMVITNGLILNKYKKASFSKFEVLKELFAPNSDLQCCTACSTQLMCEGVKFDGNTCQILGNVGIDETSEIKDGWVNTNVNTIKSK